MNRGFTIVELLVSIAIFIIMTTLVVTKYGTFNQSTLLTDTAYDIALTVRTAQTYGLSVKNSNTTFSGTNFSAPYGISFSTGASPGTGTCGGGSPHLSQAVLFADTYPATTNPMGNGIFDISSPNCDTPITLYTLTRGATISAICVGTGLSCPADGTGAVSQLDLSFKRPDPDAIIYGNGSRTDPVFGLVYIYAEITLKAVDNSTRIVAVRQNGQISVKQ